MQIVALQYCVYKSAQPNTVIIKINGCICHRVCKGQGNTEGAAGVQKHVQRSEHAQSATAMAA